MDTYPAPSPNSVHFGNGALAVPIHRQPASAADRLPHNQGVLEPAADETADDVECADQQSDLEPEPVAPGQKLQGCNDDADDKGDCAPEDPAIAPVALGRIGICLPADRQADCQRSNQPYRVAHQI